MSLSESLWSQAVDDGAYDTAEAIANQAFEAVVALSGETAVGDASGNPLKITSTRLDSFDHHVFFPGNDTDQPYYDF